MDRAEAMPLGLKIRKADLPPGALEAARAQLTVTPATPGAPRGAPRPPSFEVFREGPTCLYAPRHWAPAASASFPDVPPSPRMAFRGALRDDLRQPEAVDAALASMRSAGGALLVLPCGQGKTTIALHIASRLRARTLVVVHRDALMAQWRERAATFLPDARVARLGDPDADEADVVLGMLTSLARRRFPGPPFELVVVDECHHVGAACFSQAFFGSAAARYTLGLSATPRRRDGLARLIEWFVGPTAFRLDARTSSSAVATVRPLAWRGCVDWVVPMQGGRPCLPRCLNALAQDPARTRALADLVARLLAEGRRVLLLCDRRALIDDLVGLVPEARRFVGGQRASERAEALEARAIVATFAIASEGFDVPSLDTVVLATPKSDVEQAVGRVLREAPGKRFAPLVVDVRDAWAPVEGSARRRGAFYRTQGFRIEDSGDLGGDLGVEGDLGVGGDRDLA